MPMGRCVGCGQTDTSERKMAAHIAECSAYAHLYRTAPEQALSPQEAQRRWVEEAGKEQAKVEQTLARAGRAAAHKKINDRKLSSTADRWASTTAHRSTSVPVTTPAEGLSWGVSIDNVDPSEIEDVGRRVAAMRFRKQW